MDEGRRKVLRGIGATAAAVGVGATVSGVAACAPDEDPESASTAGRDGRASTVVVVGAGLAGLTAAVDLADEGFDVTVVEARGRTGGRTFTVDEPFGAGQFADAGGEFVDTGHVEVRALADRLGVELVDVLDESDDEVLVRRGDRTQTLAGLATPETEAGLEAYGATAGEYAAGIDPEDPTAAEDAAELDALSVGEALDELALDPDARFLLERTIADEYGVPASRLSLLFLLQLWARTAEQDDDGAEAYRIAGGSQRLTDGLADLLDRPVVLGSPVESIVVGDGGVRVTHAGGRLDADAVVVSCPLPTLAAIEFEPGLPDDLAAAVADVQYGWGGKELVQYRERFWLADDWSGASITDLPMGSTYADDRSVSGGGGPGILIGYTAAEAGRALESLSEEERVGVAVDGIEQLASGSEALVGAATAVTWSAEPFSGGTYIAYAPGQVTAYWAAIRQSLGRVVLAGEHTSSWNTYMEGAVRSGQRAAADVSGLG